DRLDLSVIGQPEKRFIDVAVEGFVDALPRACGIIEILRLIERANIDCRVGIAFLRQRRAERSGTKHHGQCRTQPPSSQSGFAIMNVEAGHIILLRGKCLVRLSVSNAYTATTSVPVRGGGAR